MRNMEAKQRCFNEIISLIVDPFATTVIIIIEGCGDMERIWPIGWMTSKLN